MWAQIFNPFYVPGLFLYFLKTSKNFWFSGVFRGYRKRPVAWNGLIVSFVANSQEFISQRIRNLLPKQLEYIYLQILLEDIEGFSRHFDNIFTAPGKKTCLYLWCYLDACQQPFHSPCFVSHVNVYSQYLLHVIVILTSFSLFRLATFYTCLHNYHRCLLICHFSNKVAINLCSSRI